MPSIVLQCGEMAVSVEVEGEFRCVMHSFCPQGAHACRAKITQTKEMQYFIMNAVLMQPIICHQCKETSDSKKGC